MMIYLLGLIIVFWIGHFRGWHDQVDVHENRDISNVTVFAASISTAYVIVAIIRGIFW